MATAAIETSWKYEFSNNVGMALQQKPSRLRPYVTEIPASGEGMRPYMEVKAATATKRTARYAPMDPDELGLTARWFEPVIYKFGPFLEDSLDKIRNGITLSGKYTEAGHKALNRSIDDEIIEKYFATNKIGKYGASTVAFDTTNMRVAEGSAGLTVAKLRTARRILKANEVDLDAEMPVLVISAYQEADLLSDIQVTSRDFNGSPVLKDGKIDSFMGFRFVHSERLPVTGSDRRCPFWVKSGMLLGVWEGVMTDISPRKDLEGIPIQVYGEQKIGATRTDELKCGEILCLES